MGAVLAKATSYAEYAGAYFDHERGGRLVLAFTNQDQARTAALAALTPAGDIVDTIRAGASYADLEALQTRIEADRDSLAANGVLVASTGIDLVANAVVVGLEAGGPNQMSYLAARYGAGLRFEAAHVTEVDACNSMFDCWPPKGGFEITSSYNGQSCTSGFIVREKVSQLLRVLTAGHCLALNGGSGKLWYHHHTGTGGSLGNSFNNTWQVNATGDVGLIGMVSSATPATKNQFIGTMPNGVFQVSQVWSSGLQVPGTLVCRVGRTSGLSCGSIINGNIAKDSCNPSHSDCRRILNTVLVTFDSQGGDSGGTVYQNGPNKPALGTHVDSDVGCCSGDGWYTPLNKGIDAYKTIHGIEYFVCMNSTCTQFQ